MSLHLDARLQARDLDVRLDVDDAEVVAVLGPNGAGKSSLLAMVAGLLRPDDGIADLDGHTLFALGPRRSGVWCPPHARGTALLSQEPLLFPHLGVLDNVAFGPRSTGAGTAASRQIARRWLTEVDATELADRRPSQLSGGQAQRVAVARALAANPRLLLLDEPMSALDVGVAPGLRQMLRRVLAHRSAIIVTHDVLDALILADRVVVIDGGRVVEDGTTREVLTRPRSAYAARVAGLNMLSGTADGSGVRAPDGLTVYGVGGDARAGDAAVAVFSPSAVSVFRRRPEGSPRNILQVALTELEPRGDQVRLRAANFSADVTAPVVAELDLAPGVEVYFAVKASEVAVYAISPSAS